MCIRVGVLQSDAVVNRNYIAANTDAHPGNPSHLTHNATNPNAQSVCVCAADAEAFEEEEEDDDADDAMAEDEAKADVLTPEPEDGEADKGDDTDAAQPSLPDASIRCLTSHTDAVMSLAWSPDGSRVISGACDDFGYIHRWQDGADQDCQRYRCAQHGHTRRSCCNTRTRRLRSFHRIFVGSCCVLLIQLCGIVCAHGLTSA